MRKKMKPFLSLFLVMTMVLSPLSSSGVFAAETEEHSDAVDASEVIVANDKEETLPMPTVEETPTNKILDEEKEESNQVSSDSEKEEEGEQVSFDAEKEEEGEQESSDAEKEEEGEQASFDSKKEEEGEQASSDSEKEEEEKGDISPEGENNEDDSSEELEKTEDDIVDFPQITSGDMPLDSMPMLLSSDDTANVGNNAANIHVLKEDGTEYNMFTISDSTAKLQGDQIAITITTNNTSYSKLYFGSPSDTEKSPVWSGTQNQNGGWTFSFTIDATKRGTNVPVALYAAGSDTWSSTVLTMTIPDIGYVAPGTGESVPDYPGEEENPDPDPFDSEITSLEVVKDSDGAAFKMFKITEYSLSNDGENLTITLSTTNESFNKLYFGSIEDNPKTPVITGTPYNEAGWTFTFALPAAMKNKRIPVLLGYVAENNGRDGWYVTKGASSLYLAIPDVEVSGQTPEPTPSPEPTPGTSLEDGIYNVPTVETGEPMFRVVNCQLISKNGQLVAQIALSGTGYDYLYIGTKNEAYVADPSKWIPYTVKDVLNNETGEIESKYVYEIPVSALDTPLKIASRSAKYVSQGKGEDAWINRTITIRSDGIQKTGDLPTEPENPDPTPSDPTPSDPTPIIPPVVDSGNNGETTKPSGNDGKAEEESKYESDLSGSTSAVDSSTGLPDGVYTPDSFSWSGGTGRVKISCNKITVKNGQAYATIVFSSNSYAYVKANGRTYYGTVSGGSTSFTIPVALNKNNKILGMTTKMTATHEIEYNIYVYLAAAAKADETGNVTNSDVVIGAGQSNNDKLDEEAPQIIGLTYESETKLEYAQYLKIYHYQDGITLLEVDMTSDTTENSDKTESVAEDAVEEKEKVENKKDTDTSVETEEGTIELLETDEEKVAELYMGNVVKYLIVPEGTEIPVGLEKEVVIIDLPVDKTYVASQEVLDTMDKLEVLDTICAVGFEKDDCTNEKVVKAMEDGDVSFAGTFDKIDYKALLRAQCNLSILPSELLPCEEEDTEEQELKEKEDTEDTTEEQKLSLEEQTDRLREIAEHHAMLWIPMMIDRSADETTELGQYEWIKFYGAIFQCEDETTKLFDQAVAAFEERDN